jgi:hypothetical protein
MAGRERYNLSDIPVDKSAGAHQQSTGLLLDKSAKGRLNFALGTRVEDEQPHPENRGRRQQISCLRAGVGMTFAAHKHSDRFGRRHQLVKQVEPLYS